MGPPDISGGPQIVWGGGSQKVWRGGLLYFWGGEGRQGVGGCNLGRLGRGGAVILGGVPPKQGAMRGGLQYTQCPPPSHTGPCGTPSSSLSPFPPLPPPKKNIGVPSLGGRGGGGREELLRPLLAPWFSMGQDPPFSLSPRLAMGQNPPSSSLCPPRSMGTPPTYRISPLSMGPPPYLTVEGEPPPPPPLCPTHSHPPCNPF